MQKWHTHPQWVVGGRKRNIYWASHCIWPQDRVLSIRSQINTCAVLCMEDQSHFHAETLAQREFITCLFPMVSGWSQDMNKSLFVSKVCPSLASVHMGLQGQPGIVNEHNWPDTEKRKNKKSNSPRVMIGSASSGLSVGKWRGLWQEPPSAPILLLCGSSVARSFEFSRDAKHLNFCGKSLDLKMLAANSDLKKKKPTLFRPVLWTKPNECAACHPRTSPCC